MGPFCCWLCSLYPFAFFHFGSSYVVARYRLPFDKINLYAEAKYITNAYNQQLLISESIATIPF
jgi:hypothetical protein